MDVSAHLLSVSIVSVYQNLVIENLGSCLSLIKSSNICLVGITSSSEAGWILASMPCFLQVSHLSNPREIMETTIWEKGTVNFGRYSNQPHHQTTSSTDRVLDGTLEQCPRVSEAVGAQLGWRRPSRTSRIGMSTRRMSWKGGEGARSRRRWISSCASVPVSRISSGRRWRGEKRGRRGRCWHGPSREGSTCWKGTLEVILCCDLLANDIGTLEYGWPAEREESGNCEQEDQLNVEVESECLSKNSRSFINLLCDE